MSMPDHLASCDEINAYVANRIGFIELERPKALNALSTPMIHAMHAALERWRDDPDVVAVIVRSPQARAFCAGGDVRALYEAWQRNDHAAIDTFFIDEYRLNHAIFTYPKPYLALTQGIVMGGGMGISQGAHRTGGLRIVTDSTRIAMPETRIGLFPDVGVSWFFARTPGAIGRYLAVTGSTFHATDALYAGLADAYLPDDAVPALLDTLRSEVFELGADVVDCVLRECAVHHAGLAATTSTLAASRTRIDRHFAKPDMMRILASLETETDGEDRDWAEQVTGLMRERSPLSMAVSLEVVTRADGTMSDCLRRDLDLTRSSFARGDVVEGIRAALVDKDNRPQWRIGRIEDVTPDLVTGMFESPWSASEHPLRDLTG